MSIYEVKKLNAQENDKIVYYDYLMYKRGAGWWTGLINDDWHRPYEIQRAKYNASFLNNLPDYYFLGIPIKELLKSEMSKGRCHACAIALSLCFKEFEIYTCNLRNYTAHYNEKSPNKIDEYEHTFLVINNDDIKTVIDTSFGFITDINTYDDIFSIDDVRIISSDTIKNTDIYKFIEERKNIEGPTPESEARDDKEYQKYSEEVHKYMNMCKSYKNNQDEHLQDFFNRCLYRTSNSSCIWKWRCTLEFKYGNSGFIYPTNDMFSLRDDEFDENLYSPYEETTEKNNRVLESYHKPKEETKTNFIKSKILRLASRIINNKN